MKTRSRKPAASKKTEADSPATTTQKLESSVSDPPQVFIWPKDTSSDARIITHPSPATSAPTRYLLCPERGCFEFTRVAAPKRECRSWLLAPEQDVSGDEEDVGAEKSEGYVLRSPDLMIATPMDPLFVVLPALTQEGSGDRQMFLTPFDYLERLEERSNQLRHMLRQDNTRLEKMLEASMLSVCDTMEAGEEVLCKLSNAKMLERLVAKAQRMVRKGLPASMEEHFVKQALAVPVMSVRREESSISIADEDSAKAGAESESASTSQDTEASDTTAETTSTAATSIAPTPTPPSSAATPEVTQLLRLRTALNFMLSSYIPPALRGTLTAQLASPSSSPIDFTPLDDHLTHLVKLKQEAQALRSLSDNISRKRSAMDDEEAMEKMEAKKRKKEEEEARKKNVSHGVKKLAKADRSGMKSISSFFGAKSATGKK